ncbi:hypothetical protein VFPPC_15691 [Pochonia chlamydosporia 170]|uniref:Uncharacterized protein n=1 Tax=Pochonia chlamydosporia 170 TaxID=1380566 RepID=A0A179G0M7_METCM|nr:hypothetical protein VFPPC_15691 [Pochonia chlamydosporia 170]OAQ71402.1 hypothetical protein VFPPC_15691 [Pochonia chlamydosporia 170]
MATADAVLYQSYTAAYSSIVTTATNFTIPSLLQMAVPEATSGGKRRCVQARKPALTERIPPSSRSPTSRLMQPQHGSIINSIPAPQAARFLPSWDTPVPRLCIHHLMLISCPSSCCA